VPNVGAFAVALDAMVSRAELVEGCVRLASLSLPSPPGYRKYMSYQSCLMRFVDGKNTDDSSTPGLSSCGAVDDPDARLAAAAAAARRAG
jgi:hypothetical protein